MKTLKKYWDKFALSFILLLAGFLSIFNIWNEGYGNEFYAASVKSMLVNWKNFFFVSLDPGGWVTVDKPPVSLWVQTAFAKILGFHGWSIILPECLAAVATTAIIYHIVKRHFGKTAGLISALVLAISPIFIVISKTNNTDSVLILLMVLATWALMVAADKGQLRYILLSVVLLGIAYNAKTLEAFLILPALFAVYFFATNIKWRTRIWHLLIATIVLAVVSLSWSVIVDLTPASERPYVDNSTTNSELELAIGYNGLERITGQNSGGSGMGANNSNFMKDIEGYFEKGSINMPNQSGKTPIANASNTNTSNNGAMPQLNGESASGAHSFGNGGGRGNFTGGAAGGGMFNGGGSASIFRMFNSTLGGQDSWLLPFGLFAILGLILRMRKSVGLDKETRKKLLRNVILFGGTVVIMVGYFSVSSFFHPYYISVLAPFLAALVGIGLVEMWKMYKEEKGVFGLILPVTLAVTAVVQIVMLQNYPSYDTIMIPIVAVMTGASVISLIVLKLMHKDISQKIRLIIVAVSFAGLLVAPAVWTITSDITSINTQIPTAGPTTSYTRMPGNSGMTGNSGGRGNWQNSNQNENSKVNNQRGMPNTQGGSGFGQENSSNTKLINFLVKNNTGETYLVAVASASEAEPIILATGKPVMAIGGFSGNDKTLTVAKLEQMVKAGEIKYYLVGGSAGMGGSSSDDLTTWVKANGKAVDQSQWSNTTSSTNTRGNAMDFGTSETLYDLSSYKDGTK